MRIISTILIFIGLGLIGFGLSGCGTGSRDSKVEHKVESVVPSEPPLPGTKGRFKVERYGKFEGGYRDHEREIFVLTDNDTGKKYLAITGCGTCELDVTTSTDNKGNVVTNTNEE